MQHMAGSASAVLRGSQMGMGAASSAIIAAMSHLPGVPAMGILMSVSAGLCLLSYAYAARMAKRQGNP